MKRKGLKSGIIVALLVLAVGFAAVTTTLYITGTIKIVPNNDDFENKVIFKSVTIDSVSQAAGTTAQITDSGKTIAISTHKLDSIGETVTFTYTVENGSQYDADLSVLTCTSTNGNDYIGTGKYVTVTPANNLDTTYTTTSPLAAGATSIADTLTITMIKSYAGTSTSNDDVTIDLTCTLGATAVEDPN